MAAPVILLMGPPGSGKGTQAELLAQALDGVHLSSGQMMRDSNNQALKDRIAAGNLATSEDFYAIVSAALEKVDPETPIVLDGVGRMVPEAQWLESKLHDLGREIAWVLFITVSTEELTKRLTKRHKDSGRGDDELAALKFRLKWYEDETLPVHDYWQQQDLLSEVNGVGSVDEVADRIQEVLHEA